MSDKYYNIQVLRFFAAFAVLILHAEVYFSVVNASAPTILRLVGWAGVDVFFVISGFIMWMTTKAAIGEGAALHFAAKRLTRIFLGFWPFFLLVAAITLLFEGGIPAETNLLKSFLLIPQAHKENLFAISWTLSFELYFYLLFACAIWLGGRKQMLRLGALLIPGILLASITIPQAGFTPLTFVLSPHILQFYAGIMVALYAEHRKIPVPALLLALGVAGFAAVGWVNFEAFGISLSKGTYKLERVLLITPCAVLMMLGMLGLKRQASPFHLLPRLGDASYTIYLAHVPFLMLWKLGMDGQPPAILLVSLVAMVLGILGFSLVFYERAERPTLRRERTLFLGA